jgi:hypothetical protein
LGRDVQGKVAFARLDVDIMRWPGVLVHEAELHGAAAIVFYYVNGYAQHPSGEALNTHDGMCRDTLPVIQISIHDGRALAERMARSEDVIVTLRSEVRADPQATGTNVVGEIPGRLAAEEFLVVGAHYDAWFTGCWDNASGVAGMLAMAKALVDSEYQPEHTLLFVATDAEEFGAADSIFDWLTGAHSLLEAHPEWAGRTTCCFNFDTLSLPSSRSLSFFGSPEMMGFVQRSLASPDMALRTFAEPQATMNAYVTPWTESYSWTYFGIPVIQPTFERGTVGETHYHTQFDTADLVGWEKASEAVRLYGSLLVRLDRQPLPPYDFVTRAAEMRDSVNWDLAKAMNLAGPLEDALHAFEQAAAATAQALDAGDRPTASGEQRQQLRAAARVLLQQCSYLGGDFSHEVLYRHVHSQRHLSTLDQAMALLEDGSGQGALEVLTDKTHGLPGAFFGQHTSYATYHHFTVGAVNPGRPDLWWGRDRALPYLDCWMVIHQIRDKIARGLDAFEEELYVLREQRQWTLERLAADLRHLAGVAHRAAELLATGALGGG